MARRIRWVIGSIAASLAIGAVTVTGKLWLERRQADRAVLNQTSQLDQIDPTWTYEAMQAERVPLADGDNAALVVLDAASAIPTDWPTWDKARPHAWAEAENQDLVQQQGEQHKVADEINNLGPCQCLSATAKKALEAEMARVTKALSTATELMNRPRGRYHFDTQLVWPRTIVADLQKGRDVARLVDLQCLHLAQQGKCDEACKAVFRVCRVGSAFGEPDSMIAQLVRTAVMHEATAAAERALSLGQADQQTLARLQECFDNEDRQTLELLLHAARSERALTHRMLEALWDGRIGLSDLAGMGVAFESGWDRLAMKVGMAPLRAQQADFLRESTEELETWKHPWRPSDNDAAPPALLIDRTDDKPWNKTFVEGLQKFNQVGPRVQAAMRCAMLAMAVERYRLDRGFWPNTLQDLVPSYVKEIASDPYGAGPIRLAHRKDGLVVYSVWKDGKNDGGVLDRTGHGERGTDLGFQLWDVVARKSIPAPD